MLSCPANKTRRGAGSLFPPALESQDSPADPRASQAAASLIVASNTPRRRPALSLSSRWHGPDAFGQWGPRTLVTRVVAYVSGMRGDRSLYKELNCVEDLTSRSIVRYMWSDIPLNMV